MINSPVRAPAELAEAVRLGLNMNLESEQEIDFLDPLVRDREPAAGIIGVRINPVVGAGAIEPAAAGHTEAPGAEGLEGGSKGLGMYR